VKIKSQAHVAYQTQYHIVWIPKYRRRRVLVEGVREYLEKVIKSQIQDRYPDCYITEINIQTDHLHILMEIPPKYAVSTIVGYMKRTSSRLMRKEFEYLRKQESMWSVGYFVSSVGINESVIRKYIRHQENQDLGQAVLAID